MKKGKLINILLVSVLSIVVLNITIPTVINAQNSAGDNTMNSEQVFVAGESLRIESGDEKQEFSSAMQAIQFAQNKLNNRVNFSTSIYADIKMNIAIFTFSVELRSQTTVNEDGVVYTVDACNMKEKWLDGQKGFAYYSKRDSSVVYTRETDIVTFDTCVAEFRGDSTVTTLEETLNEFGYIDNSRIIEISKENVLKTEKFQKTETGYELAFRMKKDSGVEARQKFLRCSELVRRPSISSLLIYYTLDLYGNITKVHYSLSAYGTKMLDGYGELSAPIDIEIDQTYNYAGGNLLIPTVIEF